VPLPVGLAGWACGRNTGTCGARSRIGGRIENTGMLGRKTLRRDGSRMAPGWWPVPARISSIVPGDNISLGIEKGLIYLVDSKNENTLGRV
jgi:hypothetical protein